MEQFTWEINFWVFDTILVKFKVNYKFLVNSKYLLIFGLGKFWAKSENIEKILG